MRLSIVALKMATLSYSDLRDLLGTCIAALTGNALYPTPSPSLASAATIQTNLTNAITAWGSVGNRGSHNDLLALRAARDAARLVLFQLAVYAENTTPGDRVALSSVGWQLRSIPRHRVGILQPVQNLHQFISRKVVAGTLKIKWSKPLNAVNVNVSSYLVKRGTTSDYTAAVQVAVTTNTSFLDLNPGIGNRYYWVVPFNASGLGGISDTCVASAALLPA